YVDVSYRVAIASTVNLLRLLADETRLRLLVLLEEEELSVAELQEILGMGQSRISSHLAQLKRAGVVDDRRSGKNVYYGPAKASARAERIREMVGVLARELPEIARDRNALKLVLRKRHDKAREYFDELAGKFGRSYVPGRSWQALAHALIPLIPPGVIVDLGAGEGTLSQWLANTASRISSTDSATSRTRRWKRELSILRYFRRRFTTPFIRNARSPPRIACRKKMVAS